MSVRKVGVEPSGHVGMGARRRIELAFKLGQKALANIVRFNGFEEPFVEDIICDPSWPRGASFAFGALAPQSFGGFEPRRGGRFDEHDEPQVIGGQRVYVFRFAGSTEIAAGFSGRREPCSADAVCTGISVPFPFDERESVVEARIVMPQRLSVVWIGVGAGPSHFAIYHLETA